jgi:hypothetical protein
MEKEIRLNRHKHDDDYVTNMIVFILCELNEPLASEEVKFTVEQTTKAQRESRSIAPLFL